jgi:hypothetical protein
MKRDWKSISKKVVESEGNILVSNPDFPLEELPEEAVIHRYENNILDAKDGLSAKDIRSFLWKNRKERQLTRDRAVLWRDNNRVGFGVVTTERALERLR